MTVTIDADAIPPELKERNQWLLWDKEAERKQPFTIGDRGQLVPASWTDPDEWLSFEAFQTSHWSRAFSSSGMWL